VLATKAANAWLEVTYVVIQKTLLGQAEHGIFRCTLRFEDLVPQDPTIQKILLKRLLLQNIAGKFSPVEGGVELKLHWGPQLL